MSENDIFDELDSRSEEPSFGGGDYADWWTPDESGDEHLVGLIVELHSEPEEWTDPGDVPGTVRTVMSLGRGDFDEGALLTPKQHKQLMNGLQTANIGDLVNLKFTGYQKVNGNMMHTYEVGVIAQDEWSEMDGADDIQEAWDEHNALGGIQGDNRRMEPYTAASPSGGSDNTRSSAPDTGDELAQAAEFLKSFVDTQGGQATVEQCEKMVNDVREYDVDVEDAALMAGFSVDDGEVSR